MELTPAELLQLQPADLAFWFSQDNASIVLALSEWLSVADSLNYRSGDIDPAKKHFAAFTRLETALEFAADRSEFASHVLQRTEHGRHSIHRIADEIPFVELSSVSSSMNEFRESVFYFGEQLRFSKLTPKRQAVAPDETAAAEHFSDDESAWLEPQSVAKLMKETGCSRTVINDAVRQGEIPGGSKREGDKKRGDIILKAQGLAYLKRKGGK